MKTFLSISCGLLLAAANLQASVIFSDNFDTYTAGNLVGQGGWTQTGTSTLNPIQAVDGMAGLTTTGQDAFKAIPGGPVPLPDGATLYMDLDLTVASAQIGDYFLHYSTSVGNTMIFPDRLYAKTSGTGGFLLGWAASSSGSAYGSTVLNLNQTYHVQTVYNMIAGAANDTGALYVDGALYGTFGFGGGAEPPVPNQIAEVCLRQGTAANAPTVYIDNLELSAINIPEPSTAALIGLGLLGLTMIRRRG